MKIQNISLKQFDRNLNKVVDYDKDRDEGVWIRYFVSIDLTILNFSFELKPNKTIVSMYQDIDVSILDEKNESPDEIIGIFQDYIARIWDYILHAYPATSKDKDIFLEYIKNDGKLIYNGVKMFYDNLDKETIEDIKDKNQIKIQDEEICLNDIIK